MLQIEYRCLFNDVVEEELEEMGHHLIGSVLLNEHAIVKIRVLIVLLQSIKHH